MVGEITHLGSRQGGATSVRASYTDFRYTYSSTLQDCVEHNRTFLRAAQAKVPPHIDSISPTTGLIGVSTSVTISGNGFGTNPTVSAGTGITVTRGSFSDTQVQATFAVASNAPSGNHSVTVSTTEGTSNSVNFYVQVPTSLGVLSPTVVLPTGTTGDYGCRPGWDYGISVDIRYQVRDQSGAAIQSANMIPHETGVFADGTPFDNDIGPSRISTTSRYTASDGTFHDAPVELCAIAPFTSKTQTQNITALVGSTSYPVRSQTMTYGSSGLGHGTITNGSDVSASR